MFHRITVPTKLVGNMSVRLIVVERDIDKEVNSKQIGCAEL